MLALSSVAFRSFISSRLRSGILMAAVLFGIAGVSGVQLTNDAISRGVERSWRTTVGISHLQVRAFTGGGFTDATVASVGALPEVAAVAPMVRKWVFFRTTDRRGFVELIGVDPQAETAVRSYRVQAGRFLSREHPNGVAAQASWAQEYGLRPGDTFDLITTDGLREFELTGVLAPDEAGIATYGSVVLVGIETARQRFGMENRISAMSLLLTSEAAIPRVAAALERTVAESHVLRRSEAIRADLEQSLSELQGTLTLFGATALFVAIFLIVNTIEMMVVSQIRETGRLRAAGATRPQIFVFFVEQGLFPGAVGAGAGALLGYLLALGLATWIERSQGIGVAPITFSLPVIGLSVGLGVVTVGVASFWPAFHATRISPIEMLAAGETEDPSSARRFVALGVGLTVIAAIALLAPVTAEGGRFLRPAGLFLLLVGLVLLSRLAIAPMSALFALALGRRGGAAQRLAVRNLTRHPGRTTLTVAGFTVSLALVMGVAALGESSARAGELWTRSLIPGQYVVVSPVDQPPIFVEQFARLPGIQTASPVDFFSTQMGGYLVQAASIDPAIFLPGFDFVEGSEPEAQAAMRAGGGILIPRRLAYERGLRAGDTVPIQTLQGSQLFRIAGVVAHSFPSPDGARTVLFSRADAERFFERSGFRLIMLSLAAGEDPTRARERISELAERYGMSAVGSEEIVSRVASAIWNLLILMIALIGIGWIIAPIETANTMLMNIAERARELRVLWAGGMSRRQLQMMAVAEAAMMGVIGGVLGVAVGALLSWLVVSFSRTSGFQPEYVFPVPVAVAGVIVTALASAVAAYLPARRLGGFEGLSY